MKKKGPKRHRNFQILCVAVFTLLAVFILFPFVLMAVSSVTEENELLIHGYKLFPKAFSLNAYRYIFQSSSAIVRSYGMSILVTAIGTTVGLSMTVLMAYPLSRKDFRWRNIIAFIVFFTMLFNGGLVSQYIMWTQIFSIKNTVFAYLVPNLLMGAFNVMIIRNYFANNVPFEIIESAELDGAGEWRTLLSVVLPISKPILVTIGLMIGLAYWNDWTNGLYYINNSSLYTFQNLLNRMIQEINFLSSGEAAHYVGTGIAIPNVSLRMAIATLGVIPILMVYPFLSKYFAQGITMGAVKG